MVKKALLLFLLILIIELFSCSKVTQSAPPRNVFALGTVCTINLYEGGTDELYALLAARLNEIERVFSVHIADSEISRVNKNAGITSVEVSEEALALLEKACYFARRTNGAFDPAIGPLVQLWGIGTDNPHVPTQEEIDAILPLVDWRDIQYDREARTIFLPKTGMKLDFGAIAKGYAADELIAIIKNANVKRAIIDLGGNVYVWGKKPDGTKWRVGIKNPLVPEGEPAIRLEIGANTVVTSGAYERFFEQDGVRYHHILDPKTGYPADSGILSSTIISESSAAADALSTSAFVLGKEKAFFLFAEGFQDADITADMIIIDKTCEISTAGGIENAVTSVLPIFSQAEW